MNQRNPMQVRATAMRQTGRSRARLSPVLAVLSAAGRFVGRRPGFVLASVAVAGGLGVFGWNALMKQSGAHPAPLFASAKPEVAALEPPRRPDFEGTPFARSEPAAAATTKSVSGQPAAAKAAAPSGDAIGALLRSDQPRPADAAAPKPAVDPKANAARIVAVQKALLKTGYGPIGTDGVAGSATRQALERFERDRNLPVTGSLAPRTLKQLASASGVRIE